MRAASTTLPGDQLYPVKRTWEDMLIAFTFNVQQRDALEVEHENERLQELQELFAEKRSAQVDFAGSVTSQNGTTWIVSGVTVLTSAQTEILGQGMGVGSAVRVKGQTQSNTVVIAERIELLPSNAVLPDVTEEPEHKQESPETTSIPQIEDNSGEGSETETPQVEESKTPEPTSEVVNDGSTSGSNDSGSDSSGSNDSGSDSHNSNDGGSHDTGNDTGGGGDSSK